MKFVKVLESSGHSLTVLGDDGEVYTLNGTVAWRGNNPGNIRPPANNPNYLGAIGVQNAGNNGQFLVFPDRATGDVARENLLFGNGSWFSGQTLNDAINGVPGVHGGYAPAADHNNSAAY